MNGLLNKTVLRRSKLNIKSPSIYSIVLKNKFRRLTQPGLTRYSYDEYDHQNGTMDVCLIFLNIHNYFIILYFSFLGSLTNPMPKN
jgi:hypothetical protein